jgi:molecular chaperone DnaJ
MTSAPEPDYYELLGVKRDAGAGEIKEAFRAQARRLHPDVSRDPNAGDRFAEVSRAYAVLSKPTARILYDRVGYRGPGNGGFESAEPSAEHLALLFDVAEVEVDALEARRGATRRVEITSVGICPDCVGTGADPGSEIEECLPCGGEGRLRQTANVGAARLLQIHVCAECSGTGRIVREPCAACSGSGRAHVERSLKLRIPPGTVDGALVRAQDPREGRDVYLALRVVPHQDARLLRYSATAALALALALFAVIALAPDALAL